MKGLFFYQGIAKRSVSCCQSKYIKELNAQIIKCKAEIERLLKSDVQLGRTR